MRALGLLALLLPGLALAEGRGIVVVNGTGETIREIHISPAGSASPGPNRLVSTLPPQAQARIGFSTGCRADIRLAFASGRTEAFLDQDACTDLRVTAGGGVATAASAHPVRETRGSKAAAGTKVSKPQVEVPPWTGRSITKKFGGLN